MFGTLRYNAQSNEPEFVERASGPLMSELNGYVPAHTACDKCRSKKLRCSGHRNGCNRCRSTSSTCTYSPTGEGRGSRPRKRIEEEDTSSGASPPPAATLTATSIASQSGSKHHNERVKAPKVPENGAVEQDTHMTDEIEGCMEDFFNDLRSPLTSVDDVIADQGLAHDVLSEHQSRSIDDYFHSVIYPNMEGDQDADVACASLRSRHEARDHRPCITAPMATPDVSTHSLSPAQPRSPFHAHSEKASAGQFTPRESINETPNRLGQGSQPSQNHHIARTGPANRSNFLCQCLQTINMSLEELEEAQSRRISSAGLDTILAFQRTALGRCESVIHCTACTARPEYILLLGLILEKLVNLCETLVAKHRQKVEYELGYLTASDGSISSKDKSDEPAKVYFGSYEIESQTEWDYLTRVLIVLQIRKFWRLLKGMKEATASTSNSMQLSKAQAMERRIKNLMQNLCDPIAQEYSGIT